MLNLESVLLQEGVHDIVCSRAVVVNTESMSSPWLDISIKLCRVGENHLRLRWDACCNTTDSGAVSATENRIFIASDDQDRASEAHSSLELRTNGKDLANSHRLLGLLGESTDGRVEVWWGKEGELVCALIGPGKVVCKSGSVDTSDDIGKSVVVEKR